MAASSFSSCDSCGREFKSKNLRRGMCRRCNHAEENDDFDCELSDDISTVADLHDHRYNGDDIDDVEFNDFGLDE